MQQRRLRLGDILDDYCPRERRITNHAVVAMIDDEVKQTRCTTCDADHEYKQAKVPPQRRKRGWSRRGEQRRARAAAACRGRSRRSDETVIIELRVGRVRLRRAARALRRGRIPGRSVAEPKSNLPARSGRGRGPVHRRLIRATLPRPDGQAPERKDPEFTIRQPGMRGPGGKRGRHQRPMRPQGGSRLPFRRTTTMALGQGPRHAAAVPGTVSDRRATVGFPSRRRDREATVRDRAADAAGASAADSVSDFSGKLGLIVGVANKRSIAWAIAQATASRGARLALTYQGRFEEHVQELSQGLAHPARPSVRCRI